jgi:glyoxylase-like metal-dependent hydrolase (beta-lactamase superfamily II)
MSDKPSAAWYLAPIFLGIIGSAIMWYVLKDEDHPDSPKMIKKGWVIGIVLTLIPLLMMIPMIILIPMTSMDNFYEMQDHMQVIPDPIVQRVPAPGFEDDPQIMNQGMMDVHPEKMRTAAPLPETSMGPQIDYSKGYLVEEIKDGLYWVTDGAYQAMFLTTGQGVIAVDAPPSIGENYLKAIAEVTSEPVTHVIYSHTHNDHVGSMSMFPDDAVYIAHQEIADTLSKRNDPNRPVPTVTFEDKYTLEVGSQKLELEYYGPMHEPGNIFIYAPNQKVLMLVDVIFPGWTPFKDLAMAQDVTEFLAAHDKVLEYDFETYIGGHLTRLGIPEDVQIQKEYFQDIQASAAKANQQVSFMAIGQEVGFSNPWLVFQIYADSITQQCTDEVVPKWIDRLGGVDLFTYDHCWKISEGQRID